MLPSSWNGCLLLYCYCYPPPHTHLDKCLSRSCSVHFCCFCEYGFTLTTLYYSQSQGSSLGETNTLCLGHLKLSASLYLGVGPHDTPPYALASVDIFIKALFVLPFLRDSVTQKAFWYFLALTVFRPLFHDVFWTIDAGLVLQTYPLGPGSPESTELCIVSCEVFCDSLHLL